MALAISLLGFAIRVFHLGVQGFDWDEGFGIVSAHAGFGAIVHTALTVEPHPPLFYSFIRVWSQVAGATEYALRFPGAISGALTVPLLYVLGRILGWPRTGLMAGLLFALSPYQVWYAQEMRMYAPAALLALACICLALLWVRRPSHRLLAGYAVAMLLALYIHYWETFVFILINALVFGRASSQRNWRRAREWLLAQLPPALLFFPWLLFAYRSSDFSLHVVDVRTELAAALQLYTVSPWFPRFAQPASLGFLALGLLGLAYGLGRSHKMAPGYRGAVVAAYAAGPLLLGLAAYQLRSVFAARYLMVSAPAFCFLLALGLAALWRLFAPAALLAALGVLACQMAGLVGLLGGSYVKDVFPAVVQEVDRRLQPNDAVILDSWDQQGQFWYYHVLRAGDRAPSVQFPLNGADAAARTAAELSGLLRQHQGVWVLNWDLAPIDAGHTVEHYLAQNAYNALSRTVGGNSVQYYAAPAGSGQVKAMEATCAGDIQLEDVRTFTTQAAPGGMVALTADWKALRSGLPAYVMSWRLADAAGNVIWQRDLEPEVGLKPTTSWAAGETVADRTAIPIPPDVLPGQYTISLVPYLKASGQACQPAGTPIAGIPAQSLTVAGEPKGPAVADPAPLADSTFRIGPLSLAGYGAPASAVRTGQTVEIGLRWQALQPPSQDWSVRIELQDADGHAVQQVSSPIGSDGYPTSRWPAGREVLMFLPVKVPPALSSGRYRMLLKVTSPGGSQATFAGLPALQVQAPSRSFSAPAEATPVQADFSGKVSLIGFSLEGASGRKLAPGSALQVQLYWRDESELPTDYKVFVHLETPQGAVLAQDDAPPDAGSSPTSGWVPKQVIADRHTMAIPAGASAPEALLVAGLYDPASGQRLRLMSGGDAAALGRFTVGP